MSYNYAYEFNEKITIGINYEYDEPPANPTQGRMLWVKTRLNEKQAVALNTWVKKKLRDYITRNRKYYRLSEYTEKFLTGDPYASWMDEKILCHDTIVNRRAAESPDATDEDILRVGLGPIDYSTDGQTNAERGSCRYGHEWIPENIKILKDGKERCKRCLDGWIRLRRQKDMCR